eukprot:maker-scaffold_23-snap-gene-4.61-mRNA-1 protein AED:0.02 eAED:0.02 QI:151/1/1/1/1/1/2/320/114
MVKGSLPKSVAALSNGLSMGESKGYKVTKLPNPKKLKNRRKVSEKAILVKSIIREVGGLAPYEKRIIDLIRLYGGGADKKVYKVAKKRLGTHTRALKKREELKALYAEMKTAGK